jgi:hypothetical protein
MTDNRQPSFGAAVFLYPFEADRAVLYFHARHKGMLHSHYGDYIGASPKRLADARKLLASACSRSGEREVDLPHLCGAQYLAGYAVECALKAYIIRQLHSRRVTRKVQTWDEVVKHLPELAGAESHNLELLLKATDLAGRPDWDPWAWGQCLKWYPALRYRDGPIGTTAQIIGACGKVSKWILEQLPPTLD